MKYQKSLILLTLLFSVLGYSQMDFKQFVPQNPDVAALFKSTITPVNEYSGTANISIPLYTLSEGNISVPIGISYATGGIQVSEESSVVGLGWALNAGGAITRTVEGLDDFRPGLGLLSNPQIHPDFPVDRSNGAGMAVFWDSSPFVESLDAQNSTNIECMFTTNGQTVYYDLPSRSAEVLDADFQHDKFMFNFIDKSGSFILEKNSFDAFLLTKSAIKVWFAGSGNGIYSSVVFWVQDESGTLYEFRDQALTEMENLGVNQDYVSSWHLSEITDVYGNTATFNYNTSNSYHPFRSFNQIYNANVSGAESNTSPSSIDSHFDEFVGPKTKVTDVLLESIVIKKNGQTTQQAVFEYDAVRKDINSQALVGVKIFNKDLEPIESFDLYQSYFGTEDEYLISDLSIQNGDWGSTIGATKINSEYPHVNLRLRLDSIARNVDERHTFRYHGGSSVPNKTSMSQDYWGFFNGKKNANVFIPEIANFQENYSYIPQPKVANRFPDENSSKMFSLKSVTYPTRGTTDYEYELNTFDQTFNAAPITTIPVPYNAAAVSLQEGVNHDSKIITPNKERDLKINFSVVITGWDTSISPNRPAPPQRGDIYVVFKKMNGTIIKELPMDYTLNDWYSFEPGSYNNQNGSNSILITEDVGVYSYDAITSEQFRLDEDQYIIEAYFDSHGGLYKGQAQIYTVIEEEMVSQTENYSIGGGLRIAKLINKDYNGDVISQKVWNYHYQELDENGIEVTKSYGKVKTAPDFSIDKPTVLLHGIVDGKIAGANYYPRIAGSAGSQTPWSRDQGSFVGYSRVESSDVGPNGPNGRTVKTFINQADSYQTSMNYIYLENERLPKDTYHNFPAIRVPHNGLPIREEYYNAAGDTLKLVEQKYLVNGIDAESYELGQQYYHDDFVISAIQELPIDETAGGTNFYFCGLMSFQLYPLYSNEIKQVGVIETTYDQNGQNPVTTTKEMHYDNDEHRQVTRTTETTGEGIVMETKIIYPDDIDEPNFTPVAGPFESEGLINQLNSQNLHRINIPVQKETSRNGKLLAVERTEFGLFDNIILPDTIYAAKSAGSLQPRLIYEDYALGNPVQMKKVNGVSSSIIWGYDNTLPIAKIDNATYAEIANALGISEAVLKSFNEANIAQLDALRNTHPQFMITTFEYIPLKGVTKITDARGQSLTYNYDSLNRLKEVWDSWQEGDYLLSDYLYHYKGTPQN